MKIIAALFIAAASLSVHAGEVSLMVGGVSKHAETRKDGRPWNEHNTLIGIEYRFNEDWAIAGARYKNSEFAWSNAGYVQWTPLHAGPVHFGALLGGVDGYSGGAIGPAQHRQEIQPIPALTADYRGKGYGVQLTLVPGTPKSTAVVMLGAKIAF